MLVGEATYKRSPRVQTTEEQQLEALRRLKHLFTRPDGMTKQEIIKEARKVTAQGLRLKDGR